MDYFSSLDSSSLDPDTPTLFELLSAKELDDLINPSIRFIVSFYAQRHPRYLLRLATKFDEIYAVLMGIVEYYHLKNWNASFTEKFYGLKRTNVLNTSALRSHRAVPDLVEERRRLTKRQVIGSLALLIAVPYIREKLDVKYERMKAQSLINDIDEQRRNMQNSERAITLAERTNFEINYWFFKLYPYTKGAYHLATLLFYLGYLFGKTSSHSVSDFLLGMKYSRLSGYDYMLDDQRARALELGPKEEDDDVPMLGQIVNFFTTRRGLETLRNSTLSGLSYALPTSMFMLKFLEWWSGSELAHRLAAKSRGGGLADDSLPIPRTEADEVTAKDADQGRMRDSSLCPLCGEKITNPTAIETGVVYCYTCIFRHLEGADRETGGHCPVTGQRLLQCSYSVEKESWEVGGLRRIMV